MYYNTLKLNSLIPHICAQCGSKLILLTSKTEKIAGNLFPQTTTTFRCSDKDCQDRRDKEMEKTIQLKKEKKLADERRLNEKLQKRQQDLQLKNHL